MSGKLGTQHVTSLAQEGHVPTACPCIVLVLCNKNKVESNLYLRVKAGKGTRF